MTRYNNNLISKYKSDYNNIQNLSSNTSIKDSWKSKQYNKVTNTTSNLKTNIKHYSYKISNKLHGVVNSNTGNHVINIVSISIFSILLVVLFLYSNKVDGRLKKALQYGLIGTISLLISMYGLHHFFYKTSFITKILSIILIGVFAYFFSNSIINILEYYNNKKISSPWIIEGNKNAKNSLVISQNPQNSNSIILYRSDNEDEGLEFSYSLWFIVQDYQYNSLDEYKHIFHKGDTKGEDIFCPKMVLLNENNTLRISINLIDNSNSPNIDINNIPINKWVHVSLVVKQTKVEVFINGFLKKVVTLNSIPRQNFNDLWIKLNGGFEGFISKFQYHRRALDFGEIEDTVKAGPAKSSCDISGIKPPYLYSTWWIDRDIDIGVDIDDSGSS
jgi:hypothetical protein